ncbi:MAG: hypothetical protein KAX49_03495 [Halanaerobiales bacterium]|nr:hypothetical protein [Halanaerobiales bacterium]
METLYIGPTGSGKTTILLEKYLEIAKKTKRTEECLVFVKNATSVTDWRRNVDLQQFGPINAFTYFGFIQRELTDYWSIVEKQMTDEIKSLEPTFMNVETSHYLMSQLVDKARSREGTFASINATSQQIAVQLIDNLNHAAMNGLTFEEIKKRLFRLAQEDQDKVTIYKESLQIMRQFIEHCINTRCLDYSLIVDLYNQYLLSNENYYKDIKKTFRYLLVDNLETTVPTAQDLILKVMEHTEETYLAFNPEGGFTSFFGGNPKLAQKTFFPICACVNLDESHTSSKESRELAKAITEKVLEGKPITKNDFIKGEIPADLRGDMLLKVADKVKDLLDEEVLPGEVALIAPIIDKVMEFTFERYFTQHGFKLANLTRNKRLLDEPFAQALITLALLVNSDWKLELNFSSLVQTLSLILKLDPIRSSLLADEIFKNQMVLPDLDEINLRDRLGFENSDKYDLFIDWVKEKQSNDIEMEHFFQRVFGELLAPLSPEEKDILACRQIIASITKFKKVMKKFNPLDEKQLGKDFIDMVLNGTLAAEVLFRPPSSAEHIILATPYTFLFSPYIKQVKYLFWLDIASENWLRSSSKELTNPFILSRQWQDDDEWTDEVDQNLRKEQLINYLQSLLSKCTDGLYLANSYLSSHGWEQDGRLYEWLEKYDVEVNQHD